MFTLILTMTSPVGIAIHHIPGFPTELHAQRAAEKWLDHVYAVMGESQGNIGHRITTVVEVNNGNY